MLATVVATLLCGLALYLLRRHAYDSAINLAGGRGRSMAPSVPSSALSVALILSLLVLGVFNTASMVAMIRSYSKDKDFIYREDILNLDRNRRQREGHRAERGR